MSHRETLVTANIRRFSEIAGTRRAFTIVNSAQNVYDGDNNPKYREVIAAKGNATNRLVVDDFSCIAAPGVLSYATLSNPFVGNVFTESYWGCGVSNIVWDGYNAAAWADLVGPTDSRARTNLYKKIDATNQQFQAGVFIGELRETLRMLRSPAAALRKGLSTYLHAVDTRLTRAWNRRRGKTRRQWVGTANDIVAQTWLEYVFGWRPLINDIEDATKAVIRWQNASFQDDFIQRLSGHAYRERVLSDTSTLMTPDAFAVYLLQREDERVVQRCRVIYSAGLQPHDSFAPLGSASRLLKLVGFDRWQKLVPTAWELIPYSFVADYFVNIGDVLNAWATDVSAVKWVYRTTICETVRTKSAYIDLESSAKGGSGYTLLGASGGSRGYVATISRHVERFVTDLGIPNLYFSMPPFDSAKWINLLALGLQTRAIRSKFTD